MSHNKNTTFSYPLDYEIFEVEQLVADEEYPKYSTFLLSSNRDDYTITKEALRDVSKRFPQSVLHEDRRILILKNVYSRIVGTHLKPMNTECLESEF
jgi:hypothetical protein